MISLDGFSQKKIIFIFLVGISLKIQIIRKNINYQEVHTSRETKFKHKYVKLSIKKKYF